MTNTITKTIGLFLFGLLVFPSYAQDAENLVPNGSFESLDKDPKKLGSIENAKGWYSPTGVRADLFVPSKKSPDIDVPLNIYGKEEAKDGSNYAGIVGYSFNDTEPRSYVSTKLSVPMKKGTRYCVQFNVSMSEASKYASNQIGMNISKKAFGTEEKVSIIDKASVLQETNKIFDAPFGWELICGIYEAEGGEKYITIGNFSTNEDTKNDRNKKSSDVKVSQIIAAYYYIDNVSIGLIDDMHPCSCVNADETDKYSRTIYQRVPKTNDKMTDTELIQANILFFGFAKDRISQVGEDALDSIAEKMIATPGMKLQINAYSDAEEEKLGAEKSYYSEMDSKRANAVALYLINKGVAEGRLILSQQGSSEKSSEISATDDEDMKQAKNRRVEFKVR